MASTLVVASLHRDDSAPGVDNWHRSVQPQTCPTSGAPSALHFQTTSVAQYQASLVTARIEERAIPALAPAVGKPVLAVLAEQEALVNKQEDFVVAVLEAR